MLAQQFNRIKWPVIVGLLALLLVAALGISHANLEVIIFKFLVFCPALMLVHATRKRLFPYIDLKRAIHVDTYFEGQRVTNEHYSQPAAVRAALIYGIFAYYIGMTYVLTSLI